MNSARVYRLNAQAQRREFTSIRWSDLILIKVSLRIPQRGLINNTKKSNKGGLYEGLRGYGSKTTYQFLRTGDQAILIEYFPPESVFPPILNSLLLF